MLSEWQLGFFSECGAAMADTLPRPVSGDGQLPSEVRQPKASI